MTATPVRPTALPLSHWRAWPWATAVLAFALLVVHSLEGRLEGLVLARGEANEAWRWISAHWTHSDAEHLLWNLGAFIVLGAWIERHSRGQLLLGLTLGAAAVTVWFFSFSAAEAYCGLSGVLHTLLPGALVIAAGKARAARDSLALAVVVAVAAGLLVKVGIELATDYRWASIGAWPSAPGAHAAGLLGGLAWWVLRSGTDRASLRPRIT